MKRGIMLGVCAMLFPVMNGMAMGDMQEGLETTQAETGSPEQNNDILIERPEDILRDELTEPQAVSMIREQVSQGDQAATITVENKTIIKNETWRFMMREMLKKEANLTLMSDYVLQDKIISRLYIKIDVKKAYKYTWDTQILLLPGVPELKQEVESITGTRAEVVQFLHSDDFLMDVQAAIKINFDDMDTENLHFYLFDDTGKTFTLLENPQSYIDINGYLHFTTDKGGIIVISDKEINI